MPDQQILAAPARRDPVLRALKAAALVLVIVLAVVSVPLVHRWSAMASMHCPRGSVAVWDAGHGGPWWLRGRALCGASLVISGTSR